MKYKFYCTMVEDEHVIEFLNSQKIKYDKGTEVLKNRIFFTISYFIFCEFKNSVAHSSSTIVQ